MQISKKYRIFTMLMALLMAFSSVGYSVNLHYCQGSLKGFSLFGEAKSCHESRTQCPNHKQTMTSAQEKDCCSNKTLSVDNLDELSLYQDIPGLFKNNFYYVKNLFFAVESDISLPLTESRLILRPPPLYNSHIYILYETFLL